MHRTELCASMVKIPAFFLLQDNVWSVCTHSIKNKSKKSQLLSGKGGNDNIDRQLYPACY